MLILLWYLIIVLLYFLFLFCFFVWCCAFARLWFAQSCYRHTFLRSFSCICLNFSSLWLLLILWWLLSICSLFFGLLQMLVLPLPTSLHSLLLLPTMPFLCFYLRITAFFVVDSYRAFYLLLVVHSHKNNQCSQLFAHFINRYPVIRFLRTNQKPETSLNSLKYAS